MGKLTGGVEPSRKGGAREGAGRKPSEFVAKCKEICSDPKFMKWAQDVLAGKPVEPKATISGAVVKIEASTGDKMYVWEKLAAYGFGKPVQPVGIDQSANKIIVEFKS